MRRDLDPDGELSELISRSLQEEGLDSRELEDGSVESRADQEEGLESRELLSGDIASRSDEEIESRAEQDTESASGPQQRSLWQRFLDTVNPYAVRDVDTADEASSDELVSRALDDDDEALDELIARSLGEYLTKKDHLDAVLRPGWRPVGPGPVTLTERNLDPTDDAGLEELISRAIDGDDSFEEARDLQTGGDDDELISRELDDEDLDELIARTLQDEGVDSSEDLQNRNGLAHKFVKTGILHAYQKAKPLLTVAQPLYKSVKPFLHLFRRDFDARDEAELADLLTRELDDETLDELVTRTLQEEGRGLREVDGEDLSGEDAIDRRSLKDWHAKARLMHKAKEAGVSSKAMPLLQNAKLPSSMLRRDSDAGAQVELAELLSRGLGDAEDVRLLTRSKLGCEHSDDYEELLRRGFFSSIAKLPFRVLSTLAGRRRSSERSLDSEDQRKLLGKTSPAKGRLDGPAEGGLPQGGPHDLSQQRREAAASTLLGGERAKQSIDAVDLKCYKGYSLRDSLSEDYERRAGALGAAGKAAGKAVGTGAAGALGTHVVDTLWDLGSKAWHKIFHRDVRYIDQPAYESHRHARDFTLAPDVMRPSRRDRDSNWYHQGRDLLGPSEKDSE